MDSNFRVSEKLAFFFNKELGHGPRSTVFEGRFEDIPVAVKRVQCADKHDAEKALKDFKTSREKQVMVEIERDRQCNVLGYYTSVIDGRYMYFALELCDGHLGDYVRRHELTLTYPPERVNRDITSGVSFLHSKNIAHRDLKPENVYFVIRQNVIQRFVIGDFGTSKSTIDDYFSISGIVGTFGYIAREVWKELSDTGNSDIRSKMSVKADIFALGCLFFFTVTRGQHPFGNIDKQNKIFQGESPDLHLIEEYRHSLKVLLKSMLEHEPDKRPVASAILDHPALWSAGTVLKYFKDTNDDLKVLTKHNKEKGDYIENEAVLLGGKWAVNIPKKLKLHLENVYTLDKGILADTCGRVSGVLKLISYIIMNYRSFPAEVREELGSYPDGHANLWMKLCPYLLMHIYDTTNEHKPNNSHSVEHTTSEPCIATDRTGSTNRSQEQQTSLPRTQYVNVFTDCEETIPIDAHTNNNEDNNTMAATNDKRVAAIETTQTNTGSVPDVIQQTETHYVPDERWWSISADKEIKEARLSGLGSITAEHTVLCIDISGSIAENEAWTQTTRFVDDFIQYSDSVRLFLDQTNECISVVSFGHETKVVQRLTSENTLIKTAFKNIQLGGPSPLYGGIWLSAASARTPQRPASKPRLVIISDGKPTDACLFSGPEVLDGDKLDKTKAKIVEAIEHFKEEFDFVFIPVGQYDEDFFRLMSSVSGGPILQYDEAKDLIKTSRNASKDMYYESFSTSLPEVGSRVCRGPDWKWNDQDGCSTGTVIGHDIHGNSVWVEWDIGEHQNMYRYGNDNCYDVLLDDSARSVTSRGRLTVGCVVVDGSSEPNVKGKVSREQKGVVIKVLGNGERVQVRWKDGRRSVCSFGENNTYDVWPWSAEGK